MLVDVELRKAAAYISAGKNEVARSILSKYLNDFPESDLAWLLLSYVIEEPRKQLASVSRALRLNPKNAQAKDRHDQLIQKASEQSSQSLSSQLLTSHPPLFTIYFLKPVLVNDDIMC